MTKPVLALSKDLDAFYRKGKALLLWDDKEAWCHRKEKEGNFYTNLLSKYSVATVIDVAAASGFHSFVLVERGFSIFATDGFSGFVEAGLQNQAELGLSFPFLLCNWNELKPERVNYRKFDAALCLGGSLHHTDQAGIRELFNNISTILNRGGIFVIEQRNYEQLLSDKPKQSSHPCGWSYSMSYSGERGMNFHLTDNKRAISVRFEATITLESELIELANASGFVLRESIFEYGCVKSRSDATWIEYVFQLK